MKYFPILIIFILLSCENRLNKKVTTEELLQNTTQVELPQEEKIVTEEPIISDFDFVASDFQTFYERFIIDSIFQLQRVSFPLKGHYNSYEEERDWTKKDWSYMDWDFRSNTVKETPEDSISIIQSNDLFFWGVYCNDCGFSFEMQFDRMEGDWFLTYRQENNY